MNPKHLVQIVLSSESVEKLVLGHIVNMHRGEASVVKVDNSSLIVILLNLKDVMALLEKGVLAEPPHCRPALLNDLKPTVIKALAQLGLELLACKKAMQSSKELLITKLHDWGMKEAVKQRAGVASTQPIELLRTQHSLKKDYVACNELIYLMDTIYHQLKAGTMVTLSSPYNITGFSPDGATEEDVNKAMAGANPEQKEKMKADYKNVTNPKKDTLH